jgi:hypothetical protein
MQRPMKKYTANKTDQVSFKHSTKRRMNTYGDQRSSWRWHHTLPRYAFTLGISSFDWNVTMGFNDIKSRHILCNIFSSQFSAAPREGHLSRVLRIWDYLKKYPNRAIHIDSTEYKGKPNIKQKKAFDFAKKSICLC